MDHNICPTCGRQIAGQKTFEGFMARMLVDLCRVAKTRELTYKTNKTDKHSTIVTENIRRAVLTKETKTRSHYARIADLKYWELLYQKPQWNHYGIYQITDLAIDFIAGKCSVASIVTVRKGNLINSSQERVTFQQAIGKGFNEIEDWISEWVTENRSTNQAELFL
jgi:hypothetical protein